MVICGIVSEYNPFHKGHEKHIALTREKTGADMVICAMSGNFVQRGEPAVFDKWTRAACALLGGADAVIELPLLSAIQSAEGFASGGVCVLAAAGADSISFGCETDDIALLERIAQTLSAETDDYKEELKRLLKEGLSFPKARMMAAFQGESEDLLLPNAILGIEYIKAILRNKLKMKPYAIKRIGEDYHSTDIAAPYASATAIRRAIEGVDFNAAYNAMPEACTDYVRQSIDAGLLPVMPQCFDKELLYALRRGGREYIASLPDVSEGLENRIYDAVDSCGSRAELIAKVKTKRYTYTRISRILLCALLGITKKMIEDHNSRDVGYIRILGVRNRDVLSRLSRSSSVPLITGSVSGSQYNAADLRASDIYSLSQKAAPFRCVARDLTEKLIILEDA
jgi:predicted nucleotidyltransferase